MVLLLNTKICTKESYIFITTLKRILEHIENKYIIYHHYRRNSIFSDELKSYIIYVVNRLAYIIIPTEILSRNDSRT